MPEIALTGSRQRWSAAARSRFLGGLVLLAIPSFGCGGSQGVADRMDAAHPDTAKDVPFTLDTREGGAEAQTPDAPLGIDSGSNDGAGTAAVDAGVDSGGTDVAEPDVPGLDQAEPDTAIDGTASDDAGEPIDGATGASLDTGIDGTQVTSIDSGRDARGEAAPLRLVVPTVSGTTYTFATGSTVFAVDSAVGARVVTYALAQENILTTPATGDPSNYGSTFWTSPQSDWNWPPPSQIDPGAYSGSTSGGVLTLTSATASSLGLAVSKRFQMDADTGDVTIRYDIINKGTKARAVAPWEISRVAAGGLTFFPLGEGTPAKGSQDLLELSIVDGVAWFAYDAKTITSDQKVFADGAEGWIAHVDGDLLLVKAFADTTPAEAAPSEAEIEIYTNAAHTYIEVENQGAYASLAAKATSQWTVRWFLRRLDPAITVDVGSVELLALVRALVGS